MFERWIEDDLLGVLTTEGMGCVAFSTLAQGLLSNRYLNGIPMDSRAARPEGFLQREQVHESVLRQIEKLHEIASGRGQSLAQMALAWVLREPTVTSALVGASRVSQIEDCIGALDRLAFGADELQAIEAVVQTSQ
jgi:L-glyceraldehyde 3-phosphate reductase